MNKTKQINKAILPAVNPVINFLVSILYTSFGPIVTSLKTLMIGTSINILKLSISKVPTHFLCFIFFCDFRVVCIKVVEDVRSTIVPGMKCLTAC